MILELLLFVVLFVASIVFHEIGHLIYIKKYGGMAEIVFRKGDLDSFTPKGTTIPQTKRIIAAGLLLGFIPLLFLMFVVDPLFFFVGLIAYVFGCKHDIEMLGGIDLNKDG